MSTDDEILERLALDGSMDYAQWPGLLDRIVPRLDHIAHNEFPIPKIPLPTPFLPSSREDPPSAKQEIPSSQDTSPPDSQKENVLPDSPSTRQSAPLPQGTSPLTPLTFRPISAASISAPQGTLPQQLLSRLSSIQSALKTQFTTAPPHTAQRFAELVLRPTLHYRTLPSYLRALDRVISVSSAADVFPLPELAPPSGISNGRLMNGISTPDSSGSSGADDFIGGAELTPISWLIGSMSPSYHTTDRTNTSDLRTESTSLIDGPNGAGSLETVTVTVNGIASATHEPRRHDGGRGRGGGNAVAITPQPVHGDRAARNHGAAPSSSSEPNGEEAEERITARGPDEIGVTDTGPQAHGPGGFDVEAALGRKGEGENMAATATAAGEDGLPVGKEQQQDGDGDYVLVDAEGGVPGGDATATAGEG